MLSNKTLGIIASFALLVSLISIFSIPGNFVSWLTGFGATGQIMINISEYSALNVTQPVVDFGNGTIAGGFNNCTMYTDGSADPLNCFTPSWGSDGPNHGGFAIENIGNTVVNVTLSSTKNTTDFWGVAGGKYMYKCRGNGTVDTVAANYIDLTAGTQNCTRGLSPDSGSDGITIDINITIPATATGFKNDTITVTGTKA